MYLRGVLLALFFAVLDVAVSAPIEKEKIDPVKLNHFCLHMKKNEKDQNKSPVLLIHGLCTTHANWNGIYETLAFGTGRRICAVDLRNHGDSPWNNRSDVEAMAVDIGHFLDEKKIQKVNIIGHSLGGKVAVHYTLKNPARVESLVVEDMRPNDIVPKGFGMVKAAVKLLQEAIKSVPDGLNEEEAKKAISDYFLKKLADIGFNDTIAGNPENIISIRFVSGKWQYKTNLGLVEESLQNPEEFFTPSLGLYKGPTMFIYGTESIFDVAGDENNIRKLFPNVKMVPVKGAGHAIHGHFRQFDDEVIKLLNSIN